MNKLIWELFLMVRELMPASAENSKRQAAWSARFARETGYDEPSVPYSTAPLDIAGDDMAHPQLPLREEEAHEPEDEPEPVEEEHSANPHARRPVARPKAPAHRKK